MDVCASTDAPTELVVKRFADRVASADMSSKLGIDHFVNSLRADWWLCCKQSCLR